MVKAFGEEPGEVAGEIIQLKVVRASVGEVA